jgi:hypothetical protein
MFKGREKGPAASPTSFLSSWSNSLSEKSRRSNQPQMDRMDRMDADELAQNTALICVLHLRVSAFICGSKFLN